MPKDTSAWKYGTIFVVAALLVLAIWAGNFLILQWMFIRYEFMGQMGDLFGASNALFSGLALAALIVTLWMQREELQLQRTEAKETRELVDRQATAQERQTDIQAQQAKLLEVQSTPQLTVMLRDYWVAASGRRISLGGLAEVVGKSFNIEGLEFSITVCNLRPVPVYVDSLVVHAETDREPEDYRHDWIKQGNLQNPYPVYYGQSGFHDFRIPPRMKRILSIEVVSQAGDIWSLKKPAVEQLNQFWTKAKADLR